MNLFKIILLLAFVSYTPDTYPATKGEMVVVNKSDRKKQLYKLNAYLQSNAFISKWDLNSSNSIKLPLVPKGEYDFVVEWGDGQTNKITSYKDKNKTHTYAKNGLYIVKITGKLLGWSFYYSRNIWYGNFFDDSKHKIIEISQWGDFSFKNTSAHFKGADNLTITATDIPLLDGVTSFRESFKSCSKINKIPNLGLWNTSSITTMSEMFAESLIFNQALNNWDVSNVKDMRMMFARAYAFNQPLESWDVSGVKNMSRMFINAINFNQPLDSWDVSSVANMSRMFLNAYAFNQPLESWDVGSVKDMNWMFARTYAFNQPLDSWDVSNVEYMGKMFYEAKSFKQSLDSWSKKPR